MFSPHFVESMDVEPADTEGCVFLSSKRSATWKQVFGPQIYFTDFGMEPSFSRWVVTMTLCLSLALPLPLSALQH